VALGYVHHLSKRTSVYATYARLSNDGGAAFAVGSPPAAKAGASSSGYELGLRHSF
jgi:predicted porin